MVTTWKNESELSEAKEVGSKTAEVDIGQGNSVLAALTEQVAYLMAALDMRSSLLGNQSNRERQQSTVNSLENSGT